MTRYVRGNRRVGKYLRLFCVCVNVFFCVDCDTDSVVLESSAFIRPGRQSEVSPVCNRNIKSATPRICVPRGNEWNTEIPNSSG